MRAGGIRSRRLRGASRSGTCRTAAGRAAPPRAPTRGAEEGEGRAAQEDEAPPGRSRRAARTEVAIGRNGGPYSDTARSNEASGRDTRSPGASTSGKGRSSSAWHRLAVASWAASDRHPPDAPRAGRARPRSRRSAAQLDDVQAGDARGQRLELRFRHLPHPPGDLRLLPGGARPSVRVAGIGSRPHGPVDGDVRVEGRRGGTGVRLNHALRVADRAAGGLRQGRSGWAGGAPRRWPYGEASAGTARCQSVVASYAAAARSSVASAKGRARSISPTGSPGAKPHGTLIAGSPVRLAGGCCGQERTGRRPLRLRRERCRHGDGRRGQQVHVRQRGGVALPQQPPRAQRRA